MKPSEQLITKQKVASLFGKQTPFTEFLASLAIPVTGLNRFNEIAKDYPGLWGKAFAHQALDCFGVSSDIPEECLSYIPKEGPCIIVCNHPFGMVDGLTVIDRIGDIRPDIKILTNFLLSSIEPLSEYFLPVNPFTDRPGMRSSLQGLKMAKEHLQNGGVLAIFPAGEVSSDCNPEKVVKDIPWQVSMMKLIKNSRLPVVPVYFHGQNSALFHKLGKIHPSLRTVRLIREATNKQGLVIPVRIAKPIAPSEYAGFKDYGKMAAWLYARTYALEADVRTEKTIDPIVGEPVQAHVPVEVLLAELEKNKADLLFTVDKYEAYFSKYEDIPNFIHEIGVCREETFRAVGEGTGTSIDLDEYDTYYRHLYIWDRDTNSLVGCYRFGLGYEILEKKGIHGFYVDSLFRYSGEMIPVLEQSLELGRSFVCCQHQKSPLPLNLLLKGIVNVICRDPKINYCCGPVTTSGAYPLLYRSLILKYLKDYHSYTEFVGKVSPIDPFEFDFGRVNVDDLIADRTFETPEQFDRFLLRLSSGRFRMPTLVKKYLRLGVKVVDFNVDPTFNYCVDTLIFMPLSAFPADELSQLAKGMEDIDSVYKRFNTAI